MRAVAWALVCVGAITVAVFLRSAVGDFLYRRRVDRRHVVLDDVIQQNARANYQLLARSVRLHQQVLDADAVMPFLSADQRRDLLAVVTEFTSDAITKGTQ